MTTASDTMICTAGDARFSGLLLKLLQSIRNKPSGSDIAVGVLDTGIQGPGADAVRRLADRIVEPGWDIDLSSHDMSAQWLDDKRSFKAMTSRASLPKHFPGYHTYIWIDADCWLQGWEAITLLIRGAAGGALAIAPELDRAYANHYDRGAQAAWLRDMHTRFFGPAVAASLYRNPILNCGVFALRGDSPLWNSWHQAMQTALDAKLDFNADQFSLNKVVYCEDVPKCLLPATCNWLVNKALPKFDPEMQLFTEPYLPNRPIGILHLSGDAKQKHHGVEVIGSAKTLRTHLQYLADRIDNPA